MSDAPAPWSQNPRDRDQMVAHHAPSEPGQAITGLERDCLRQAVHDLRGPLNTSVILLDVVRLLAQKDPATVGTKLAQVVQELQRAARMLDHLVGTSDSVATELAPVELVGAVTATVDSRPPAPGVALDLEAMPRGPVQVLSCPARLGRALEAVLERCETAMPDGGVVQFTATPRSESFRLVIAATGPRVVPPRDGLHLGDSARPTSWFPVMALVRGIRGHLEVLKGSDMVMQVVIDLPRNPTHTS